MSRRIVLPLIAVLTGLALATPAEAGPLVGAVSAIMTAIKGSFVLQVLAKLAVSVVLSRLAASLAPKPKQPGIKTEGTSSGSQNPASFILGLYATDGVAVAPPMSHGSAGGTPNAYLTYVIEVSDVPGVALNALIINGERCTLGGSPHADYGLPVTAGTYSGHAWVKFYDGTQTVVDPMLLAKYASYPQRAWTSAMVGNGIAYAIVTFLYNRNVYTSFPAVRFELLGIKLYDPRKDTTVGGSGAHRIGDPSTWERTTNPIIMVYNIHLGIALPGGSIWGGGMPQADIPLASVFAAANACDALVDDGAGGTEARFRAGYEVFVSDEPAEVCEELLKACLGQAADVGGLWRFQAGDPELATFFMTDDDVLVSLGRERQPFPSIESTYNGITGSFPHPAVQWEANESPPIFNATWEAEDGGKRRLVNVNFNAVPYPAQVQRNMQALIADHRRFLTHGIPLPPEATVIEPLDTLSWTSSWYGYTSKLFEVVSTQEDPRTGVVQLSLRERDPSDTAVVPGYFQAVDAPSALPVIPDPQDVPSFAVSGIAITGSSGEDRRPALQLTWSTANLEGIRGLEFEVRRTGTLVVIAKGTTTDIGAGQLVVSEGILPITAYEVRAILVSDRQTAWTAWTAATSPDVPITRPDIADGAVSDQIQVVALGPFNRVTAPSGSVIAVLTMGPIPPGNGWRRFMSFWFRSTNINTSITVNLERRKKEEGGGWQAWTVVDQWTTSSTAWDQISDQGGLAGSYDDFEYRVAVAATTAAVFGNGDNLRDIYLTVTKVTK